MMSTGTRRFVTARALLALVAVSTAVAAAAGCRGASAESGPEEALRAFVDAAHQRDVQNARRRLTTDTLILLEKFDRLADAVEATNIPRDLLGATMQGFASERPKVLASRVEGEKGNCVVRYRNGHEARLDFKKEDAIWKLDLQGTIRPSLDLLDRATELRQARERGEAPVVDSD